MKMLQDMRLVLIGRTGSGKSAIGNSILGQPRFESRISPKSVTKVCHLETCYKNGMQISIVDTPGLLDTSLSNAEVTKEITKCLHLLSPGPHAFLFVLRIGRFTEFDAKVIERYMEYFGDCVMDRTVFVFTGLDLLKSEGVSFEQYLTGASPFLKNLLQKYTYITVDSTSADNIHGQRIIEKSTELVQQNGKRYYSKSIHEFKEIKTWDIGKDYEERMNEIAKAYHDLQNRKIQEQVLKSEMETFLSNDIGKRTRSRRKSLEIILKEKLACSICNKENLTSKRKTESHKAREPSLTRPATPKRKCQSIIL